jgi:hypothetical protein
MPVSVEFVSGEEPEMRAKFVSNVNDRIFYINCDEIYDDIEKFENQLIKVTVSLRDANYKAECRIIGRGSRKGVYETVRLEAAAEFIKEARRSSARIETEFQVGIHSYIDNPAEAYRGASICGAFSKDVSRDGIYLVAEYDLGAPKGTMFTVSFYLASFLFVIPAKVMRIQKSGASTYDYGFLFDFSEIPELQDKLISAIFKVKLNL